MTLQMRHPKNRAADLLIDHFEREILNGNPGAGQPMPTEREIVQQHGVSRTVAREAIQALARKGLIYARPGFRPVVAEPGYDAAITAVGSIVTQLLGQPTGVRNLFSLRILMEASLVRQAALHANADDIKRLEAALADNFAAISDTPLFYETDVAFHRVLYEIPGNPILPSIHKAYTEWLSTRLQKMQRIESRNQQNYDFHRAIFEAILRRDADTAEEALRDHLAFAWKQISETFVELAT
ncbi:DNA-binding transcriptional regulator, FadR family [Sulfitobacter marinus]|uniref:DNA-binding transcriptional regulator, FadR family n=1 Tax=Sulfitobacter marinus TaxID=394264 RepID=A0A1I6QZW3_9RHOB|nr:FCD domain-containing protein [Sulfitobacter marinus]SFS58029.1 DNA-binding transcriptional regulator, FadR family [Sulfitobacter marinus]